VSSTTPPDVYSFTVNGTGSGITHSVNLQLEVYGQFIRNGGFETGSFLDWTIGGDYVPGISMIQTYGSSYSALLGASSGAEPNADSWIYQTITIPSGLASASLSFWYWPATSNVIANDWQEAQLQNSSGTKLAQVMKVCSNAQAWTQVAYDLRPFIGQTLRIYFNDHENGNAGKLTYMYVDDVSVTAY
jgi:hypothetical protein